MAVGTVGAVLVTCRRISSIMYGIIVRLVVAVPAGERIGLIVNIMEGIVAERAVYDRIVRIWMHRNVSWCAGGYIEPLWDRGKVLVL